ncbi:MAG TPA: peptidoglycan bridge formation glycyltransferase FemA/FemB family protein [Euzebyales bacterium]|nr:peptidoglycan bridge formation glycyltransferase FemA/FemB family protein [Euzebyales bacterium]
MTTMRSSVRRWSPLAPNGQAKSPATAVRIRRPQRLADPAWDAFVAAAGGHYAQSTAWASFKAMAGWRVARLEVGRDGAARAGAQMLIRPLPLVGSIGYVPEGPVIAGHSGEVVDALLDGLLHLCRRERVRYLVVKPAQVHADLAPRLERRGFRDNTRLTAGSTSATVRVDLTPDADQMVARMRKSTRANIRRGLSRGLRAREGTAEDFETYLRLEAMAAKRKGFSTMTGLRHRQLWNAFSAAGLARIFLVEDEDGDAVSAQVAVPFGPTMYTMLMAWSGEHSIRKPNELLEWTAMMWAKERGYRYYDFEGITSGRAASGGADRPDRYVSDYKLGFGGEVIQTPVASDLMPNRLLQWGYRSVLPRLERVGAVQRLEKRVARSLSEQRQRHGRTAGSGRSGTGS